MKRLLATIAVLCLLITPISQAETSVITEAVEQNTLLLQLKKRLAQAQYRYYVLQNNIENAHEGLEESEEVITNLEDALAMIDTQISATNKKILSVNRQIEVKKMEIADTEDQIQILKVDIEEQKAVVSELTTLLYVKRGIYYDDEGVNPFKVLASPLTISETLQKITFIDLIEADSQAQFEKLVNMEEELKENWENLRVKREELSALDVELSGEKTNLDAQRQGKQNLLDETRGDQAIYESMLKAAGEKEGDMLRDIEIFQQNVDQMEAKLAGTRVLLSDEEQTLVDKISTEAAEKFDTADAANFLELDWPVSPSKGLTALFHDSGYAERFGVDHYAVDIRANHGSPIFAPADGVVYQVVYDPNSTRYAYIMIAHRMGVMTLYGHVSESAVQAGDFVTRGQIIGSTGATPGTVGSGFRTTGPHLHFEVWQDGVRVDPLKYMPLEEVPLDSLPEAYVKEIQSKLEEQIREIEGQLDN